MSLEAAVAVPFRRAGAEQVDEGAFVVAVSMELDWFSPDQSKRLVDVAAARGLVERQDGTLVATFDPAAVDVPEGFTPDESVLTERSAFERVLDALVDAGVEKQAAVAAINDRQRALGVTLEAAAILHAARADVPVDDVARDVLSSLRAADGSGRDDEPGASGPGPRSDDPTDTGAPTDD